MGAHSGDEELSRLRSERAEHLDEIARLQGQARDDAAHITDLESAGDESVRIEAAQRALINQLRTEAGAASREIDSIAAQLVVAERELGDLRPIRDALAPPTFVQRDGMRIAADLTPAEPEIGGDFFYVGDGPGGVVVVAVGDVVGKGLVAARRAAFARTALASVAGFSDDPCQLLRWVNVAIVERIGESADFVTAICLTFDPASCLLRVAAAGHHPALRLSSGEELTGARGGAALGLATQIECESASETLAGGEGVLLYTDGVTEARGGDSRYGIDRLQNLLRGAHGSPPAELIAAVKRDLGDFRDDGSPEDDVCLVALRLD